jgi:hypothetical protein
MIRKFDRQRMNLFGEHFLHIVVVRVSIFLEVGIVERMSHPIENQVGKAGVFTSFSGNLRISLNHATVRFLVLLLHAGMTKHQACNKDGRKFLDSPGLREIGISFGYPGIKVRDNGFELAEPILNFVASTSIASDVRVKKLRSRSASQILAFFVLR